MSANNKKTWEVIQLLQQYHTAGEDNKEAYGNISRSLLIKEVDAIVGFLVDMGINQIVGETNETAQEVQNVSDSNVDNRVGDSRSVVAVQASDPED